MTLLRWIGRIEATCCVLGIATMAVALMLDVGARLIVGHGIVGAPQLGLVGMLATAMFGVGLAADSGEHFRVRVLDGLRPAAWDAGLVRLGHGLTAVFFAVLAWFAVEVAAESYRLRDLTSLLRWPVWLLQGVFVLAFGLNVARYALFAAFGEPAGDATRAEAAASGVE